MFRWLGRSKSNFDKSNRRIYPACSQNCDGNNQQFYHVRNQQLYHQEENESNNNLGVTVMIEKKLCF